MGDEASFSVPTVLTPSQALGPSSKQSTSKQSTSTANTTNNEAGGPSKRRRNRPRQKPKSTTETNQDANVEDDKNNAKKSQTCLTFRLRSPRGPRAWRSDAALPVFELSTY